MHSIVRGLVIRAVDYKESDRILTVLTDRLGKVTVSARGARRKGSRLAPAVQLFAYSEMTLFAYGGRFRLDEAETLEQFSGLRRDLDNAALAAYIAEVLGTEAEEAVSHPDVMRLALNSLYALAQGGRERWRVKAAFELRYAALSGYAPDDAALQKGLQGQALDCARYILGCDLKRILSFPPPEEGQRRELCAFAEHYLLSRLERGFQTLDFYHSLSALPAGAPVDMGAKK